MLTVRLYMLQRVTALLMAPLVLGHIGVMIYAVQGGLSAAEILGRTQGSVFWFSFYGLFVLAVSVHAALGLRTILHEVTGLSGRLLMFFTWGTALSLCVLGMRAILAVTFLVRGVS